MISIASVIEKVITDRKLSKNQISDYLELSHTATYNLFKKDDLMASRLLLLSNNLRYDFFKHYQEHYTFISDKQNVTDKQIQALKQQVSELQKENDHLTEVNTILKSILKIIPQTSQ